MPSRSPLQPSSMWIRALLLLVLGLTACQSADEYREEADEESYAILKRGRELAGQSSDDTFTIDSGETQLRQQFFLKPDGNTPMGAVERLALTGSFAEVDLATAVSIAARNSREFQSEKESLYLAALSLTGTIHQFESVFFGTIDASVASSGDGANSSTLSGSENSSLGFTRLLESGGSFSLAIGQGVTRLFNQGASTSATSFLNLTLSLPLLRGAGRDIAMENVRQSE